MKLLITGAGGFLGSHLVDAALKHWRGEIIALCNYHSDGGTGWCDQKGVRVVRQDIRDTSAIAKLAPDLVINAAARISIPNSFDAPDDCWEVNASAVQRMVSALPKARIVQISTSEVFDGRNPPYFPQSTPNPMTPYGASKLAAEAAVKQQEGHTVCRIFNLFGPRQSPRAVIPRMTLQAQRVKQGEQLKVRLYGPNNVIGEPYTRAFLYAPWVADQIMTRIIDDPRPLVQLACSQPVKIADLWRKVAALVGLDAERDIEWTPLPANATTVWRLYGRSSDGYETREFDEAALAETVNWYAGQGKRWREVVYE